MIHHYFANSFNRFTGYHNTVEDEDMVGYNDDYRKEVKKKEKDNDVEKKVIVKVKKAEKVYEKEDEVHEVDDHVHIHEASFFHLNRFKGIYRRSFDKVKEVEGNLNYRLNVLLEYKCPSEV